jgi:3-oxoadipate enol-lactonase
MAVVERGAIRIFYEDAGSGLCVVLGHSFLCSGEMWAPQVAPLAERFRVVNVDFRGHGRSGPAKEPFSLEDMVDDVVAVLDALGVERAVWAGLSIGGMVALRAALRLPERVSGLILADTTARAESAGKRMQYHALGLVARVGGFRPVLPFVLPLMFGGTTRRTRPDLVREWSARFAAAHVPSTLAALGALLGRRSLLPRLGEIRSPCLVIVGEEDAALPPFHSREIVEAVPGARLVTIPEAGHLTSLEQPEAVTQAMQGFLASLPGAHA